MLARTLRTCAGIVGMLLLTRGPVYATVISGTITDWPESGPLISIGDGTNHVTLWWSINTFDKGWFYGRAVTGKDSEVAFAAGVTDINQITDASLFSFTNLYVGPLCDANCDPEGVGDFVTWRNLTSGHFGVLRIDDILTPSGQGLPKPTLDGTWWFQTDGSGSFSPSAIPEPASVGLVATGLVLAATRAYRRRKCWRGRSNPTQ